MGSDPTHVDRAWALLLARWILGLIFAMAGFWKVFTLGPLQHASGMFVEPYADTFLPAWSLWLTGATIPAIELIAGALLLVGWRVREALRALGAVLVIVTFGHLLAQPLYPFNQHVVPRAALVFLLLWLPRSEDRFTLESWLARRRRQVASTTAACLLALLLVPLSGCGTADRGTSQDAELPVASSGRESGGEVRVYVADRYESVRQLAPDTLETVAVLDVGLRPHGLIVSPDHRTLYVTVETTNELVKVDIATHEILGRVEVALVPNEPTITHDGRYVFVPSRGAGLCDVVDTETMQVVKQLATGGASHNAYTSADGSKVFVTSMGDDLITVIDVATLEIERQIPLGVQPRPVALTGDLGLAYVAISGLTGFVTLDLIEDEIIDRLEIPIPPETPVPPLDTYTHGLLMTPNERELWVAAYATDTVYGFTLPERQQFAAVAVPGGPHWLALHPDGEPLYASLESTGKVAAIHRGLREVIREADVGDGPTRIIAFRRGEH